MVHKDNNSRFDMLRPVKELSGVLLAWYDTVHQQRDMPWRRTKDPYAIWLSETMLQQTQVETVKPYYARFLGRFPTVLALAEADLNEVLAHWAGLGYYRRARFLHEAAREIVKTHGGRLPEMAEQLETLPGVGKYTAGAVASIAYGQAAPVVDGNVMRVLSRLTGYDRNIAEPKNAGFFWELAGRILREKGDGAVQSKDEAVNRRGEESAKGKGDKLSRYGDINQSLMELGATVCVPPPARPGCLVCPVREFCRAFAEGRQMELPVKEKRKAVPEVRGVAVVVVRKRKTQNAKLKRRNATLKTEEGGLAVLMMKRPGGVLWEGMWEFPVLEMRNTKHETRKGAGRGVLEEIEGWLGMEVKDVRRCGKVVHVLTHRRMVYEVVYAEKRETRNSKRETGDEAGGLCDGMLPACREGGRYVEARWVGWPLVKGELAWGRVVEKIAEAAKKLSSANGHE
jgi:A/G-specific adenine glycosylase